MFQFKSEEFKLPADSLWPFADVTDFSNKLEKTRTNYKIDDGYPST